MAATSSYIACAKFSMLGWLGGRREMRRRRVISVSAQQQTEVQESQEVGCTRRKGGRTGESEATNATKTSGTTSEREEQEHGQGIWRAVAQQRHTAHEFVWTEESCHKVYSYFQELVDHYEGAPLTEYTLRLIGSDIEHYTRKLLYDGEIKYNMNARVLNFSMGKPRILFNNDGQLEDVQS
ncbi:hypothetical protein OIU78_012367 [Salix suchowensis]|nr:hypothetical protein OIU78_012367 [Salix suchowensis]